MLAYRPGERLLAMVFTFVAGFLDSVGFIFLGGVFLSFMSGNTTRSATAFVDGKPHLMGLAGSCIILFLVGVMLGALVRRLVTRSRGLTWAREYVLLLICALLVVASSLILLDAQRFGIAVVSVAIGAMNSIFERRGEVAIPLTYMTGTLVKMGQRFVDAFFDGSHVVWLAHLVLWTSLSIGAIAGALAFRWFEIGAVHFVTVIVVIATVVNARVRAIRRERGLPI